MSHPQAGVTEILGALASNVFELFLLPTEKCNFRCTYCYEDFRLGRMPDWVVTGVKRLLDRRAEELDLLSIQWFGGEPLLAPKIVEDIQGYAQGLAQRHSIEVFSSSMTTNAYWLDAAMLTRLVGLGVHRYQVALDGPAALHDQKRVQANGKPTFARVWANLESARDTELDFELTLRVHVDHDNLVAIPELIEQAATSFGGDSRFLVNIRPLSRLGGPNDKNLRVLRGSERSALDDLKDLARQRGLRLPQLRTAPVCYAAKANSFAIRSNGDVVKCTVAFDHPTNQVGRIDEEGSLNLDQRRMLAWTRGLSAADPKTLHCPLMGIERVSESNEMIVPVSRLGEAARQKRSQAELSRAVGVQ